MNRIVKILENERGATAIEYGLIVSLISMAAIAAIGSIGSSIVGLFATVPAFG
ncbi:MAG TPA: Flp family type IVb pilin [Sphingomicrobium sp.]|jgi:pilus assembly protein Flp/PilA|nr:Flp family type IVb pilin [Sphingomicrobium sp.]